jgi:hypothetical protein
VRFVTNTYLRSDSWRLAEESRRLARVQKDLNNEEYDDPKQNRMIHTRPCSRLAVDPPHLQRLGVVDVPRSEPPRCIQWLHRPEYYPQEMTNFRNVTNFSNRDISELPPFQQLKFGTATASIEHVYAAGGRSNKSLKE